MKIINVMRIPRYLGLAVASSLVMSIIYIYTQVLGIVHNVDIWISNVPLQNLVLFLIFAGLFGVTFSFQIYNWRQPKTCSADIRKSAGTSSGVTFGTFLVAQCPACASLGALFLPVGVLTFITAFSWLINLASIGLMLFVIYYLGGFR